MSLNVSLSTAVSSLLAIEQQLNIASNNISNANTVGYTEKSATVAATESAGVGTGVTVLSVGSDIDTYLLRQVVDATAESNQASTSASYYDSLQQILGEVSTGTASTSGSDIASDISSLSTDITALADSPSSASDKSQVVADLTQLADDLRSTSANIQALRQKAEDAVTSTVDDINTQLSTIAKLNVSIANGKAAGESTADLEDERNTALQSLSADIGINYYIDSAGRAQVYTKTGQLLVDGETAMTVSHTTTSGISASTTYSGGGIGGITVEGNDITDSLGTGTLAALVEQRDTVLTGVQSELDALASSLSTAFNAVSNLGSASPPVQTLTGSGTFTSGSAVDVDGSTTVQVTVTDSSGDIVSAVNVPLDGDSSVGDIVSSLDDAFSSSGVAASATLDANGHLVIQATGSSDGVAVSTLSGSVGGTDFSSYFGLNDLFVDGTSAATIRIKSALSSNSASLPTGTLSTSTTVGATAVASGDATIANDLADALTAEQSFSAAGNIGATKATFSGYATDIISDISTRYTAAGTTSTTAASTLSQLQDSFSNEAGVNTDSETALLTELQNQYAASAQIITTVKSMFASLLTAVQS
jgi:flagellar hook-associated protein 1 FlgK